MQIRSLTGVLMVCGLWFLSQPLPAAETAMVKEADTVVSEYYRAWSKGNIETLIKYSYPYALRPYDIAQPHIDAWTEARAALSAQGVKWKAIPKPRILAQSAQASGYVVAFELSLPQAASLKNIVLQPAVLIAAKKADAWFIVEYDPAGRGILVNEGFDPWLLMPKSEGGSE